MFFYHTYQTIHYKITIKLLRIEISTKIIIPMRSLLLAKRVKLLIKILDLKILKKMSSSLHNFKIALFVTVLR
jgi:hypothetical protein